MHFDDRLATVLRSRADSAAMARIQYRQLLDLLGTLPGDLHTPQVEAAYARLAELSRRIGASDRVAMLGDPGLRLRCPRLVAALATSEPQVAGAAIRIARLREEEWIDLAPALPLAARGVMRERRDLGPVVDSLMHRLGIHDRGLPPVASPQPPAAPPPAVQPEAAPLPPADAAARAAGRPAALLEPGRADSIGAIVRRIEDYKRARSATGPEAPATLAPRLPLGDQEATSAEPARSFDFTTDSAGRIASATAGFAPMTVGLGLASGEDGGLSAPAGLALAFRRRQPLRGMRISIAGAPAIAGDWRLDAAPRFDPVTARFLGYAGRLRRAVAPVRPAVAPEVSAEGDRIRQLLHELRTPVNAIQGFAEVIQQQLFGPSPHEYRALAATIAGDAARILAGFEELDRLARLDTGALEMEPGNCDLAALLAQTAYRLQPFTAPRDSGLVLPPESGPLTVALGQPEAERLIWRIVATLAGAAAPGERLAVEMRQGDGRAQVAFALPPALSARNGEELFQTSPGASAQTLSAGMFGAGFSLRLARSEARAAGGSLTRQDNMLVLELPGLTGLAANHSKDLAKGT